MASAALQKWGHTMEYKQYRINHQIQSNYEQEMQMIFKNIGALKDKAIESDEVLMALEELQSYINENFYDCSDDMMVELAWIYQNDESFKANIDQMGGKGTAQFAHDAIKYYYEIIEG